MSDRPVTSPAAVASVDAVERRVVAALRQGAILIVCLLIGGAAVSRLRPVEIADRGIVSTPFLWAAALWLVVLILHAAAFETSQMRRLEREPLMFAAGIGVIMFAVGIANVSAGDSARRILYLGTNAIGTVLFWWAVFSLAMLCRLAIAPPPADPHHQNESPTVNGV